MMNLQVYIVLLGALVLVTIILTHRAFIERQRPGARTFGLLMLSMTIWSLFYLLEITLPHFQQKIFALKMLYLGMTLSAPFWLGFALRYTVHSKWWAQGGRIALLAAPGGIAFLLGLTNEYHHLIWWSLAMPAEGTLGPLRLAYGIGFWIHAIIAYMLISGGCLIYINIYIRSPKYLRKQTGIILLGVLVILFANILFVAGGLSANIDPTPFSFALSAPLLAIGYFRFGLFNLFPIAAPVIVENLRDAVIVVDEQDHVTKVNLAAKNWFGLRNILGAFAFDVLPKPSLFQEKWEAKDARIKFKMERDGKRASYDASITHLYRNDESLLGRVIVIHDITQEQELLEAEFRHSVQMGLLEEVGRKIADSLDEREILQTSINAMTDFFGFAEVAVSLLTEDHQLELAAIAGTQDFGFKPKYRQAVGKGVVGHTAEIQQTYLVRDVTRDPYYYSNAENHGSALGIPLLKEKELMGVLYIESAKLDAFSEDDVQMLETLAKQVSSAMQRARLYTNTREHLQVLSAVQSISQVVSSSLELETIYQSVVDVLKSAFQYTYITIYLLQDDHLHLGAQFGYSEDQFPARIHIHEGISGRTIKLKETQFIADVSKDPDFLRFSDEIGSEICVPLLKDNMVLGTLNVEASAKSPLTQADADMLTMLAGPIALALDNARLHAQVKITAITDPVSGLYNRRAFEEILAKEIERATRSGNPLSLIIFDIDSFKDYNDTWGHPAGDVRLKATADLIRSNLRKYDIAARYGGDEFAIILPNTDRRGARFFALRILSTTRASAPKVTQDHSSIAGYTLSIGVATFPKDGDTFASLVLAADHAELIAKRLGKNRIITARELKK